MNKEMLLNFVKQFQLNFNIFCIHLSVEQSGKKLKFQVLFPFFQHTTLVLKQHCILCICNFNMVVHMSLFGMDTSSLACGMAFVLKFFFQKCTQFNNNISHLTDILFCQSYKQLLDFRSFSRSFIVQFAFQLLLKNISACAFFCFCALLLTNRVVVIW